MKIETADKKFAPVTLTIESPGELSFFRDLLGAASYSVCRAYGMDDHQPSYLALNKAARDNGLPTTCNAQIDIKIKVKE